MTTYKQIRRGNYAWTTRGVGAGAEKWRGGWSFQRCGCRDVEGGVRRGTGVEGSGDGWGFGGRARVFRSSADCGARAESARGVRLPDLSQWGPHALPGEGCG